MQPRVTRRVQLRQELIVWRQLTPDVYTVETYKGGAIVACEVKRGVAPIEFRWGKHVDSPQPTG